MAKKARTPPPPRKVQAPRQRTGGDGPNPERRARLLLYGVAALGILGLVAAVALFAFGRDTASAQSALEQADCTLREVRASAEGVHVEEAPKRSEYNTWPPTSGPHANAASPFDFYEDPVPPYFIVHNLEHGGIAVFYGDDLSEAALDELREWYRSDPRGVVVAPLPELGSRLTLGSWNTDTKAGENGTARLATCPRFDEKAFDAFREAYRFKGPEPVPPENLDPGE